MWLITYSYTDTDWLNRLQDEVTIVLSTTIITPKSPYEFDCEMKEKNSNRYQSILYAYKLTEEEQAQAVEEGH